MVSDRTTRLDQSWVFHESLVTCLASEIRLYAARGDRGPSCIRSMKAAIYNSHMLPMGGSERVTLETIGVLEDLGWDVDLYLIAEFKPSDLVAGFGRPINTQCRFRMTRVPAIRQDARELRRTGPYFDLARSVLDKRVERCDFFIDMVPNLSSHLALYLRMPDVAYWNSVPSDLSSLNGQRSIFNRTYTLPLRVLARRLVNRWKSVKVHVANSEYTRNTILERLRADLDPIVIYPPVDIELWSGNSGSSLRTGVVSLGRFDQWKRHDLQLRIAREIDAPFRMIGRAIRYDEVTYLARMKAAADNKLVEFHVNVSQQEAKRILTSSRVFVHTADSEPFGISVVEAIAAGCIPIVRNEGGVPEIVPYEELLFDTVAEAKQKIRIALTGEYDHLARKLKEHIRRFDSKEFRRKFRECFRNLSLIHN